MSELKPCPFCNIPPASKTSKIDGKEYYSCLNVDCPNGSWLTAAEWNTRPIEDALTARIAELEAKIDNWQDCYFEFESIAPDGTLKISVLDLYNRLTEREARVAELEAENAELKECVARLKTKNKKLKVRLKAAARELTYWDHQNCKCSVVYKQAEEGAK